MLLDMAAPGQIHAAESVPPVFRMMLGKEWTGPGGVGDYRLSNGNTHEVVNAAHSVARGDWVADVPGVTD